MKTSYRLKYLIIIAIFMIAPHSAACETLRMGYLANFWALQPAIVKGKGWDKEAGIEIEYFRFPGPAALMQAFASGQLDAMNNNLPSALLAFNQGVRFKIVSSLIHGDITLIGRKQLSELLHDHNMLEALQKYQKHLGRPLRVITNSYGSVSQILINYWLKKECPQCAPLLEIKYAADGGQAQQIYLSGNADLISAFEPYSSLILSRDKDSRIILNPNQLMKIQPGSALVIKADYLKTNPEQEEKIAQTWERATQFLKSNPNESLDIIDQVVTAGVVDSETLSKALVRITPYLMSEAKDSIPLLKQLHEFMCAEKYLACDLRIEDLI